MAIHRRIKPTTLTSFYKHLDLQRIIFYTRYESANSEYWSDIFQNDTPALQFRLTLDTPLHSSVSEVRHAHMVMRHVHHMVSYFRRPILRSDLS